MRGVLRVSAITVHFVSSFAALLLIVALAQVLWFPLRNSTHSTASRSLLCDIAPQCAFRSVMSDSSSPHGIPELEILALLLRTHRVRFCFSLQWSCLWGVLYICLLVRCVCFRITFRRRLIATKCRGGGNQGPPFYFLESLKKHIKTIYQTNALSEKASFPVSNVKNNTVPKSCPKKTRFVTLPHPLEARVVHDPHTRQGWCKFFKWA